MFSVHYFFSGNHYIFDLFTATLDWLIDLICGLIYPAVYKYTPYHSKDVGWNSKRLHFMDKIWEITKISSEGTNATAKNLAAEVCISVYLNKIVKYTLRAHYIFTELMHYILYTYIFNCLKSSTLVCPPPPECCLAHLFPSFFPLCGSSLVSTQKQVQIVYSLLFKCYSNM